MFPQGKLDCYEVVFSDGRRTRCNDQHLWSVFTSKGNLKTVTLREMIDKGLRDKRGSLLYMLPSCDPVEYPKRAFAVDPYVIGVFLGDGCCGEKPLTLSSSDEEIVANVARLLGAENYHKESKANYNWCFKAPEGWNKVHQQSYIPLKNFQTKDVLPAEVIKPSGEKRIPPKYLFASRRGWQY